MGGGITLSRCDLNLSVRDTDVNDDLPRTFGDRVGGRLGGGLAAAAEVRLITKITYLRRGPLGDKLTEMSDEPGFASWFLMNRFWIGDMLILCKHPSRRSRSPDWEPLPHSRTSLER